MTEENPYIEMEASVLEKHISQIKGVMETNKMSTLQFFGEAISEENQAKVDEHASLTKQVSDLEAANNAKTLSENETKLSKLTMDSVVSEITSIDANFPIKGILESPLDNFQKIDMLNVAKEQATYTQSSIDAVKSAVGTGDKKLQGFGNAPEGADGDADAIVAKLAEKNGVKLG